MGLGGAPIGREGGVAYFKGKVSSASLRILLEGVWKQLFGLGWGCQVHREQSMSLTDQYGSLVLTGHVTPSKLLPVSKLQSPVLEPGKKPPACLPMGR